MAKALESVPETIVRGIFPWCFKPERYAAKPEYMKGVENLVRSSFAHRRMPSQM